MPLTLPGNLLSSSSTCASSFALPAQQMVPYQSITKNIMAAPGERLMANNGSTSASCHQLCT